MLPEPGQRLSIPNLITLGRILLVPIVVWAITSGGMRIAFFLFLAAGISDGVDGFLAKRFHMTSELGAYLDPLADKALIVSIYISLGIAGALPIFLVILVVSRDIMIISAFMLSWLVGKPMPVRPLAVSKANTLAQILLAILVLAERGFGFDADMASKPKPRSANTRMASSIWAKVLAFETANGRTGIGLPTSHDSMKAEMIMMSRETTRMTRKIGSAPAMPSEI